MNLNIGIIGGAGYTAGELLRLLIYHPNAHIVFVHSNSNAGNLVSQVHTDLVGDTALRFSADMPFEAVDVVFLCLGHGDAVDFLAKNNIPKHLKIIDLSQDFRWGANTAQNTPDTEGGWIYGLPELNKTDIVRAQRIANPGCFATAIQLALLPLAQAHALKDDVHVHAITGSTGAGQKPTDTSHFSWRNNNVSIYEAFKHRHLKEITQSVRHLMPNFEADINFLPVRGNFTRGIYASIYTKTDLSEADLKALYGDFYKEAVFTHVSDQNPHLKQVVNSNKAILNVSKQGNKAFIIAMIDNLLKGASGQAVENMNLLFGLPQDTGLRLKSVAF